MRFRLYVTSVVTLGLCSLAYLLMHQSITSARRATREVQRVAMPLLRAVGDMENAVSEAYLAARSHGQPTPAGGPSLVEASRVRFEVALQSYAGVADDRTLQEPLRRLEALKRPFWAATRATMDSGEAIIASGGSLPSAIRSFDEAMAHYREVALPVARSGSSGLDNEDVLDAGRELLTAVDTWLGGGAGSSGADAVALRLAEMKRLLGPRADVERPEASRLLASSLERVSRRIDERRGAEQVRAAAVVRLTHLRNEIDKLIDTEFYAVVEQRLHAADVAVAAQMERTTSLIPLLLLAAVSIVIGIALLNLRTTIVPIGALLRAADAVGAGDFRQRVAIDRRDELGDLGAAFNRMAERLLRTTVSRRFLTSILGSMAEALFVLRDDMTVLEANPSGSRLVGRPQSLLKNQSLAHVIDMKRGPSTADEGSFEALALRPSGERIPVLMAIRALPPGVAEAPAFICTAVDLTQQKHVEHELIRSRDEIRALYRTLQNREETERARLALELHDELGAVQSVLAMKLFQLDGAVGVDRGHATHLIAEMHRYVDEASRALDRIVNGLRPPMLDHFGLGATIEWYVGEFRRHYGVSCNLAIRGPVDPVAGSCALAIFRVLQECLNNAGKYAHASKVQVRLRRNGNCLVLTVADNGIGCTRDEIETALRSGLRGIRERVAAYQGDMAVRCRPGAGFLVRVRVQCAPEPALVPDASGTAEAP
jgi:signal transduction histidine kinase